MSDKKAKCVNHIISIMCIYVLSVSRVSACLTILQPGLIAERGRSPGWSDRAPGTRRRRNGSAGTKYETRCLKVCEVFERQS